VAGGPELDAPDAVAVASDDAGLVTTAVPFAGVVVEARSVALGVVKSTGEVAFAEMFGVTVGVAVALPVSSGADVIGAVVSVPLVPPVTIGVLVGGTSVAVGVVLFGGLVVSVGVMAGGVRNGSMLLPASAVPVGAPVGQSLVRFPISLVGDAMMLDSRPPRSVVGAVVEAGAAEETGKVTSGAPVPSAVDDGRADGSREERMGSSRPVDCAVLDEAGSEIGSLEVGADVGEGVARRVDKSGFNKGSRRPALEEASAVGVVAGAVDPPLPVKLTPDVVLSASDVLLATFEEVVVVGSRRLDRSGSNNPAVEVGVGVADPVVLELELVTSPPGPNKIPLEESVEDGASAVVGASDEVDVVG
jgi:hypothetical protein